MFSLVFFFTLACFALLSLPVQSLPQFNQYGPPAWSQSAPSSFSTDITSTFTTPSTEESIAATQVLPSGTTISSSEHTTPTLRPLSSGTLTNDSNQLLIAAASGNAWAWAHKTTGSSSGLDGLANVDRRSDRSTTVVLEEDLYIYTDTDSELTTATVYEAETFAAATSTTAETLAEATSAAIATAEATAETTSIAVAATKSVYTFASDDDESAATETSTSNATKTSSSSATTLQTITTSTSTSGASTISAGATTTSTSDPSTTTAASSIALPSVLRGANIGGWLVLEEWMDSSVFDGTDAVDQWTFDQTDNAAEALQAHWSSYFTEADVVQLASWGINAVRIPIGFWAYNNTGTPYLTGADAYLEQAIEWCRSNGIVVLIDCHGSPGSQNGFDNSGHAGAVDWQTGNNLEVSITVLETMAKKYGSQDYADVVFGLEIVNEPISWDQNNFATTQQWAQEAYTAVIAAAENDQFIVVMHDAFEGPSDWLTVSATINGDCSLDEARFWIDTHLYQNQVASDSLLTQAEHIEKACNYSTTALLPASDNLPVIVGEFTVATNICANPDGSTVAGSTCYIDGCQCSANVAVEDWETPLVDATRMFWEAQLATFEANARGWFLWSYSGPGAWGLNNAVQYGIVGSPVTERKYPDICGTS